MNSFLLISISILVWTCTVKAQTPNPIQPSCMASFKQSAFTAVNTLRSFHSSQPLTTSSSLESSAQTYADKLATTMELAYSGIANVGENIFDKKATKSQNEEFCTSKEISFYFTYSLSN